MAKDESGDLGHRGERTVHPAIPAGGIGLLWAASAAGKHLIFLVFISLKKLAESDGKMLETSVISRKAGLAVFAAHPRTV